MDLKQVVGDVLGSATAKQLLGLTERRDLEFSFKMSGNSSPYNVNSAPSESVAKSRVNSNALVDFQNDFRVQQNALRDELRELKECFGAWERMENVLLVWFASAFTGLLILLAVMLR